MANSEPRLNAPQDDEAIAEMCRWLQRHEMIAVTSRTGQLTLIPARVAYGPDWMPKRDKTNPS